MSTGSTVTKTIWQYSDPLPEETMEFLRGIAADYCKVKNDVYRRYSGVKNLDRLTPVYSILNEMRYCGLRERLKLRLCTMNLPSQTPSQTSREVGELSK